MPRKKKPDFEASLEELEKLVTQLESGDLTLEESLKAFEKGVELTRACQSALSEAEKKVEILTSKNAEAFQPFDAADAK